VHAMFDLDGFMESQDPFYVPYRSTETNSFFIAASVAALIPVAPFFLPLTMANVAFLGVAGAFAALALRQALQARRYRLSRQRLAAELRARIILEGETAPQA